MAKYRKKPVVVEAEQFDPEMPIFTWPKGIYKLGAMATPSRAGGIAFVRAEHYEILTLEGPLEVSPGDWIITGIQGEKYPCKPDIFDATYEPA